MQLCYGWGWRRKSFTSMIDFEWKRTIKNQDIKFIVRNLRKAHFCENSWETDKVRINKMWRIRVVATTTIHFLSIQFFLSFQIHSSEKKIPSLYGELKDAIVLFSINTILKREEAKWMKSVKKENNFFFLFLCHCIIQVIKKTSNLL